MVYPLGLPVELNHPVALLALCHHSVIRCVLLQKACALGKGGPLQLRQTLKELTTGGVHWLHLLQLGSKSFVGDLGSTSPCLSQVIKRLFICIVAVFWQLIAELRLKKKRSGPEPELRHMITFLLLCIICVWKPRRICLSISLSLGLG